MTRYITIRPKSEDFYDSPFETTKTVWVEDDSPVKTGLFDHTGTPLYRVPDKIKPGFTK